MSFWQTVISNDIINCAFIGWFLAQIIKVIIMSYKEKTFAWQYFIGSGGMPSSHSSCMLALSMGVGNICGIKSPEFAIAIVVSVIVMYDASGVRRAAGEQAKILNQIMESWQKEGFDYEFVGDRLKELLGHSPLEVLAGAILGILVGYIYFM